MALAVIRSRVILRRMTKRNDAQVCLKLAGPLRAALEDEAASEARGLSSLIRKVLIEHAVNRVTERAADVGGAR
jgi:hypothetical protein